MRWRLETAYGDPDAVPPDEDMARFVRWSADMRKRMRQRGRRTRLRPAARLWLKVGSVVALVGFTVWVNLQAAEMDALRETAAAAGYAGLFAASVISGFNLVAPVPIAVFYPFLIESGFAPLPTLVTIAAGMTCGDFLGYMVGNTARDLAGPRLTRLKARLATLLESLSARHRLLPYGLLFVYAGFAPIPNELVVIPLAFMRYSLVGVMAAVLCGNVIFNSLTALGVSWVFGAIAQ